jgi:SAM-dependent methyltransferase
LALVKKFGAENVLDIGAGQKRYHGYIDHLDFEYFSHDFNEYRPRELNFGLQDDNWPALEHDYICDILEVPEINKFDLVLCTEVLEHVPDPVSSIKKINNLIKIDGHILVTVPFLSLAHQSPFWFSSGLSPFWFEYWAAKLNLEILELTISGDFVDVFNQWDELRRLYLPKNLDVLSFLRKLKLNRRRDYRKYLPNDLLSSGGFGVFVHLRKKS